MDAYYAKIKAILPHNNADKLEIAVVNGWRCIISKGSFSEGDDVVYIQPDAQIDVTQPWAQGIVKYLGSGGRVKVVKLRGEFSEGILMRIDEVPHFENCEEIGITHYTKPVKVSGAKSQLGCLRPSMDGLPFRLTKTDQENVQNIKPEQYMCKTYEITKKLDGTSCTIAFETDNEGNIKELHLTSRNYDLKLDDDSENVYKTATQKIRETLLANKHKPNKLYVFRGEITGAGINTSSPNKDAVGEPKFNLFEFYLRDIETGEISRMPIWGIIGYADIGGSPVDIFQMFNAVPLIDTVTFYNDQDTEEFIQDYLNAPAENGEGVVLWEVDNHFIPTGFSFKIKSKDYYSKI